MWWQIGLNLVVALVAASILFSLLFSVVNSHSGRGTGSIATNLLFISKVGIKYFL